MLLGGLPPIGLKCPRFSSKVRELDIALLQLGHDMPIRELKPHIANFIAPRLPPLKTLASLNKESRLFVPGDNSTWRFLSVSFLSDYSIWRS